MGCGASIMTDVAHPIKEFKESEVGELEVEILWCRLSDSYWWGKDVSIESTISNQTHKTQTKLTPGEQSTISERFPYIINSCHKPAGRQLLLIIRSNSMLFGEVLGEGKLSLDQIINHHNIYNGICELKKGQNISATIKVKITFTTYPYEKLSFQLINALIINKKNEDIGKRKIFVQVEVGEEVLETKLSSQSKKELPHWEDQILSFRVPSFCSSGKLTIFKSFEGVSEEIGHFDVHIPNLLQTKAQRMFDEVFSVESEGKEIANGSLKFYTLKGSSRFVEPPSPRKQHTRNVPETSFKISPIEQKEEDEGKGSNPLPEEKQIIKRKLLEPLPTISKKKSSNAQYGITLHPVKAENLNPES